METQMTVKRLFIIGAAKCGTTTVDQMLRSHPEIYMSPIKEPNYFSTDIRVEDFNTFYRENNTRDLEEYFSQRPLTPVHLDFVRNPHQYDALFEEAPKSVRFLGESSTSYLYSEVAAEKVKTAYPDASIIVCVRNPVDRLKSHLKMALQGGFIKAATDAEIEADHGRKVKGWGVSELFLELGKYGEQLERWYANFPRHQIHIIQFEDLVEDQQKVWNELCSFLNVSIFALESKVHENSGGIPKFPRLNAALRSSGLVRGTMRLLPEKMKNRLKSNLTDHQASIQIDEDRWREYYLNDIQRLEGLSGLSLDRWKK
ncbi:sulfotransferase [Phaeocystidibacter marisrubri]|uniref:Sulfotransferase n=1 Tax=Phaeocystidibacter marisrubri TaxID=1577780 RepID=A0A6L3ZER8_9FLAO|nr:sulfotransferase [Phaeocystidibacter marisrubri]